MDEVVKSVLDGQKGSLQKLESTPQTYTPQTEAKLYSFLSKYQHIDSQRIAEEFSNHMTRQPLGSKERKREATAQTSTLNLYELPISDRLTKRYEFRRSSTPRSWHSSDGSERSFSSSSDSSYREETASGVPKELERCRVPNNSSNAILKSNEMMPNECLLPSHPETGMLTYIDLCLVYVMNDTLFRSL